VACIFVDNKDIDASSMRVETLNGTITCCPASPRRARSRAFACKVNGVKAVKNEIAVRPSAPSRHHRCGHSGTSCTAGHATPHPMTQFVVGRPVREVWCAFRHVLLCLLAAPTLSPHRRARVCLIANTDLGDS
jgi:hypothetical protein